MFDWLDSIGQGIGNFGADADQFMKREMPFDSGWGAPAAAVAAYFGGPAVMSYFGEGAAGVGAGEGAGALGGGGMLDSIGGAGGSFGGDLFQLGGSEGALGSGGMNGYLDSLGLSGGGEFMPTAGNSFDLGFLNTPTGLPLEQTGSGLAGNGYGGGYTPQEQAGLDNLINQQSAKYPMDGAASKPSFQQLLGKQLMSGNLGSSMQQKGGYQYQEQPVQRQPAFAPTPAPFQVQDKQADIAALIAALRSKGTI